MPTLPAFVTTKSVLVDEPITNAGAPLSIPLEPTERSPQGVVDAIAVVLKLYKILETVIAVVDAYGNIEFCVVDVAITNPTVGEDDAFIVTVPPNAPDALPEARPVYTKFMIELVKSVFATDAHVPTPAPFICRVNWFVHVPLPP